MVAEERAAGGIERDPLAADFDPSVALAGDLVGGALGEQPAVDAAHLDRAHVRNVGGVAGHVERDSDRVLVEHESHGLEWLEDLDPQRSGAERLHVRPLPARDAHVILATLVAKAHEAVEHVVVGVQPHVRGERHRPGLVGAAHVMPVVPARVAAAHRRKGLGDLVERILVDAQQHGGQSDAQRIV